MHCVPKNGQHLEFGHFAGCLAADMRIQGFDSGQSRYREQTQVSLVIVLANGARSDRIICANARFDADHENAAAGDREASWRITRRKAAEQMEYAAMDRFEAIGSAARSVLALPQIPRLFLITSSFRFSKTTNMIK